MPLGMRKSRTAMPPGIGAPSTVIRVGRKSPEDEAVEERIRAHVRARMEHLKIGVMKTAEKCGCDQGNLTRILLKQRGIGLGMAVRLIDGLSLDGLQALTLDPDRRFFRPYVPHPP